MKRMISTLLLAAVLLSGLGVALACESYYVLAGSIAECVPIANNLCGGQQWIIGYNPKTKICAIHCQCEPL
ncbi:MAG TPA: hypothetical protein VLV83_14020 [Acidobacteriota bacterium]|nr:hypothetical protein [Acidobacteriota bacterium]